MTLASPPVPDGTGMALPALGRIYVGVDIGYRAHVAAACPLALFNHQRHRDAWKQVKTLRFGSDADGVARLQQYLDTYSTDPTRFLILMEPTGGYYAVALLGYLLEHGYAILQVENTAVKNYREKIYASEIKTDIVDARVMARMGFLHECLGEEFSIQPVQIHVNDTTALRPMILDYLNLGKEINRRQNQLQQINSATFPELKLIFRNSTAGIAARALLQRFPTPRDLAQAAPDEVAHVLHDAHAYKHAKRAAEIVAIARRSVGVTNLAVYQWRQEWLIKQLPPLETARDELVGQLTQACLSHPDTVFIESLPTRSPIWTATLIAVIGNIDRFSSPEAFRAYLGWASQRAQSGSSVNHSRLANGGVRMSRRVLSQMVLVLVRPAMRPNPFQAYYQRLVARGMHPLKAQGHVAGKISLVLYGLLKQRKLYDERRHWEKLGLPVPENLAAQKVVDVTAEMIDDVETQSDALVDNGGQTKNWASEDAP